MIAKLNAACLSAIRGIGAAVLLLSACASLIGISQITYAQQPPPAVQSKTSALVDKINANTLMVLTAGSGLTYGAFAADLATVLNDGDEFRILPVQGHSAFQNVRDVRYLRGIDMGFVQSNVLGYYRRNNLIPDISEKIAYLFKVANLEIHVITRSDITSVEQLRGKKVNFNQAGSGTQLTAVDLFSFLGLKVDEVNMRQNDAFEMLKNGEIAATVALTGKPSREIAKLRAKDGFRILPIAFDKKMLGDFAPTSLTHDDYPDLIPAGQTVETVASGTIMIAYNWPRNSDHYRRLDKFVKTFFPRLDEFRKPPRHEKWNDTVLSTVLPGWKRFEGADEWLKQSREQDMHARRDQFEQFLASRNVSTRTLPESDRNRLFEEFLKWSSTRF
jgi:TRAP transporter TAXI family solute receptor